MAHMHMHTPLEHTRKDRKGCLRARGCLSPTLVPHRLWRHWLPLAPLSFSSLSSLSSLFPSTPERAPPQKSYATLQRCDPLAERTPRHRRRHAGRAALPPRRARLCAEELHAAAPALAALRPGCPCGREELGSLAAAAASLPRSRRSALGPLRGYRRLAGGGRESRRRSVAPRKRAVAAVAAAAAAAVNAAAAGRISARSRATSELALV
mmetsp:Transcript_46807/g.147115  ORF Transcript_46807/g.147115 Transcript_46807/m.147115 type:complete len:209 (-) Transcript_46807:258-884(-)